MAVRCRNSRTAANDMPNIKNEIWHEMSNIKTTVQSLWRNTSETAEQQLHAAPLAKTLTAANFWARSPLARARGRRIWCWAPKQQDRATKWRPIRKDLQTVHIHRSRTDTLDQRSPHTRVQKHHQLDASKQAIAIIQSAGQSRTTRQHTSSGTNGGYTGQPPGQKSQHHNSPY